MERWRLITTWGADPSFNMGLDEALLGSHESPPTLRFYSWKPDTLSLGYFQKIADVPGLERAGAVVRRITGVESLGEYFRETIGSPLGLDFWIGLPSAQHERVARPRQGHIGQSTLLSDARATSLGPKGEPALFDIAGLRR